MRIQVEDGLPFVSVTITHKQLSITLDHILLDTGSAGTILAVDQYAILFDAIPARRAHADQRPLARLFFRHRLPGPARPSRAGRGRHRRGAALRPGHSHLRGGYGEHPLYHAVEQAAARFFDVQQALYFTSGYLGAAILLQGLRGEYDQIFVNEAAHASVWSGARAAGVPVTSFRHLAADDLASQCRARLQPGQRPLVISDGVFPISGEIAPVPAYAEALRGYAGATLCLDDAHAGGVLGATAAA